MGRANKTYSPISASHMESNLGNESVGAESPTRLDTPCRIHLRSLRRRLADPDGISGKALIDGLQHAGLFSNDSSREIESVTYSQEKTTGEEITEITITGGIETP